MTASEMEDVWAIAGRIMPCLLARLRRKMAVTAVFQSNQNDRVTLERHREDIFLASCSHRDALFSPLSPFNLFISLFYFLLPLWSHGCQPSVGCLFTEQNSWDNQASELREEGGGWLLHITCFSDKSFFFPNCVNKRPFFAHWVRGRELDSTTEIRSLGCLQSCCSLSCWMKLLFLFDCCSMFHAYKRL